MPLNLPTDTTYTRLKTKQYELFNRPLGSGIERSKIWVALAATAVWVPLLSLLGVSPLGRLGPLLYLAPIAGFVVLATRVGDDGRMVLISWYDALLAKLPSRRAPITNPLLRTPADSHAPEVVQVTTRVQASDAARRTGGSR